MSGSFGSFGAATPTEVATEASTPAEVNEQVDAALDTEIPATPTADSINERIKAIDDLTQASGAGDLAAILTDTNELQTDLTDGGRLDLLIDDILLDTGTTLPEDIAKIPHSDGTASFNPTALAAINAECDTALADYDPPTKAEMDAKIDALNNISTAQVNAEVDAALADYDPPTRAELTADKNSIIAEIDANETKIDTIDSYHDVPAKDSTADAQMRDVIGKKDDTSHGDISNTYSLMSNVKGIIQNVTVAAVDGTFNNVAAEVIGNKADTPVTTVGADKSIMGYVKGLVSHSLTDEERAFLGIGVGPALVDFWENAAHAGDPDSTYWTVTENGGTVTVFGDGGYGPCVCESGNINGNDATVASKDKFVLSLKTGITTLHLRARAKFNWIATTGDTCGIGLVGNINSIDDVSNLDPDINDCVSVRVDAGTPKAGSGNGTPEETDLSAYISDDTYFTLEIVLSASDCKFYIDNTLRATHETQLPTPGTVFMILFGSTCEDSANEYTRVQWIKAWCE